MSVDRFCKDCGLSIDGEALFCEFCLERRRRENAARFAAKSKGVQVKRRAPVVGGWRGRPCGGGRGVALEDREDIFGNAYAVPVAADPAERAERSIEAEDMAAGNPGDDMAEGEPCSS